MFASLWFVFCGTGALLVRVGMTLHLTGMLRSKNSAGAVMRAVVDLCLATLAFWAVGMAILDAPPGRLLAPGLLFGTPRFDAAPRLFFLLTATLLSTGIVAGVVGERSRFFPTCAASLLLGGLIVPLVFRWQWGGWLGKLGVHDFAGAAPLHLAGGLCAAVLCLLVGPRSNKYNRDGSSNAIPGHSVPLASLGVLVVLVGWLPAVLGFVGRSFDDMTARSFDTRFIAGIALNVLLAASAGAVTSLLVSQLRYGKPDVHLTYAGLLGALVSVTAIADAPSLWMAFATGLVAGLVVPAAMLFLDLIWKLDDPTGGISIHAVGAVWGLLAAGLFAPRSDLSALPKQLALQCLAVAAVAALSLSLSAGLFLALKFTTGLRSKEADEFDGLDLAEHDIGAYPDFQQTTIKSYHLREA